MASIAGATSVHKGHKIKVWGTARRLYEFEVAWQYIFYDSSEISAPGIRGDRQNAEIGLFADSPSSNPTGGQKSEVRGQIALLLDSAGIILFAMTTTVEAHYRDGKLILPNPLPITSASGYNYS